MPLRIADDVVFRDLAGEAVLLNLATGTYFGLDEIGTRIWNLIALHGRKDKIFEILLSEYEVEEAQLREDVDRLLGQLAEKGLVTIDAEETSPAG